MFLFDKKWYLKKYPEAKNYKRGAYRHYLEVGWKKNYNPSKHFSTEKYLAARPDVKEKSICPLTHYLKYGIREGAKRFETNEQHYRARPLMLVENAISKIINANLIEKNKKAKILIIFNMFYLESLCEVVYYLNNISVYDYKLIISYCNESYKSAIEKELKKFNLQAKLICVKNFGFDIYPFLQCLKSISIEDYDVIYKLHSKRTYASSDYLFKNNIFLKGRDWFLELFDSIIGPYVCHTVIDKLYNEKNVGMICSNKMFITDNDKNFYLTKNTLSKYGIKINKDYKYCAGTCFAVNKNVALLYGDMNFDESCFYYQIGNYFSFSHSIERYLSILVNYNGYKIETIKLKKIRNYFWLKIEKKLKKYDAYFVLKDIIPSFPMEVIVRNLDIFVKGYNFDYIEIEKLNVRYENDYKTYKIKETIPYKYISDEVSDKQYANYCRTRRRTDYLQNSDFEFENIKDNEFCDRFNKLVLSIENIPAIQQMPIIVNQNFEILDGLHRTCICCKEYGEKYKIKVLKINLAYCDLDSAIKFTSFLKVI